MIDNTHSNGLRADSIEDQHQGSNEQRLSKLEKKRPNVFYYTDFRVFLADYYNYLNEQNPRFSESAFLLKAGYSKSSRGYFKMIVSGKRNLSLQRILSFSKAMQLSESESQFFESLVNFNQVTKESEKDFYWKKIAGSLKAKEGRSFQILNSHYNYYSKWYLVAIREMVALNDFQSNLAYIYQKLKKKVTKKEIQLAIDDLIEIGLLEKTKDGKLVQGEPQLRFIDDAQNFWVVSKFHREMLDIAINSLEHDPYEDRSLSNMTFSCSEENFPKIREEIKEFRQAIAKKYEHQESNKNIVLNLGLQLTKLTDGKGN